nr:MAG TPA: putative tail component [Caudoviricetes sp.]
MSSDRLTARRHEFQRKMKEVNDRICANGRDLQQAFQQWVDAAHEDGLLAFLAQLADCYGRLVQRTPVDTGRARAGWHIEGEPSEWKPAPGEYEKAKAEAAAVISQEVLKLEDLSKADVIYIMNNVEYILPLEAGWSRQSSGFWALFLSELSSQLEKAAERSRMGNP